MGIKEMQGTPAHLEYIGPRGRKRRKNCIYNDNNVCKNCRIKVYETRCVGRMCCKYYDDSHIKESNKLSNRNLKVIDKDKKLSKKSVKRKNIAIFRKKKNLLYKKVRLLDINENEIIDIIIVKDKETDELNGRISINSPLAIALSKARIGEKFEVLQGKYITRYIFKSIL